MNSMKNQTGRCEADRPLADRMESLEELISVVLRISVITALIVIVAGVVVSFVRHPDWIGSGNALPALKTGAEGRIHSLSQVGTGLRDYRGRSIIMGGLLFLIMVPVIRVAVSAIIFFRQRDWIYTILTSAVLLGLIISFLLGATG